MKITYLGILIVVIVGIALGNFLTIGIECLLTSDDSPLVEQGFQLNVDGAVNKKMLAEFAASVKSLEASLNRLSEHVWDKAEQGEEPEGGEERVPISDESQRDLKTAIEQLTATLKSVRSSRDGVAPIVGGRPVVPPMVEKLPDWENNEDAANDLLFLTSTQVLEWLGRPKEVTRYDSGLVAWFYAKKNWNSNIQLDFSDGYVIRVHYCRD